MLCVYFPQLKMRVFHIRLPALQQMPHGNGNKNRATLSIDSEIYMEEYT
jgi:hypothetical protein